MPLTLRTARLLLRPIEPGDRAMLNHWMNHASVADTLGLPAHPQTMSMTDAFIDRSRAGAAAGNALVLAMRDTGDHIGVVAIEPRGRGDNLSYWVIESHWGHGYASEAAAAIIEQWFKERVKRTELISGTFIHNHASMRVQNKLGFQVVGESMVFSHFNRRDFRHWDTRLTRERWARQQKAAADGA